MTKIISRHFAQLTSTTLRWWLGLMLTSYLALLQGCASIQEPFHTLHYCNVGTVTLTSVKIQYGKVVWPMTEGGVYRGGRDTKCLGGAGINDTMPIPIMMQVSWTTEDGRVHKADVPVRSKLNGSYPTHTIQVRFNGDQVEVFEIVRPTVSRELEFRLYP